MWPTRSGKRWIGTCSPTPQGAATARRGSARGGISPASLAGRARTPRPRRCGKPGGWWARWTGTWPATAMPGCRLPGGDVVLPVRLPQGAGRWAHLRHFLADPGVWHKIDLVRVRERKAPGGGRYYAHLLTHQGGYQAAATRARRAEIPTGRRAGVDANVSNVALASFPHGHPERLPVDQITC